MTKLCSLSNRKIINVHSFWCTKCCDNMWENNYREPMTLSSGQYQGEKEEAGDKDTLDFRTYNSYHSLLKVRHML
jgi:hypothetical protein